MSEPVISVNKLGKRYRIGVKLEEDRSFREALLNTVKAPIRNFKRLRKLTNFDDNKKPKPLALNSSQSAQSDDTIWALKDVSFEVNKGEVVGIIGKNGSGKSTLLKVLSRITEPTTGCVEIKGRISSLLEVGTGFHPELTGRENIYLNGSILGMRKWEIDKKFDEIVAFSEIEKFLDTPVKRYSSGMYVRLAFAVAAHLEPEILLVDEVLAVGDVAFQKKCLGKMSEVAKGGRTVLFVSHNMGAILTLCNKAILLDEGKNMMVGKPKDVANDYFCKSGVKELDIDLSCRNIGDSIARFLRIRFINKHRRNVDILMVDKEFGIQISYQIIGKGYKPGPNFLISTQKGEKVFQSLDACSDNIFEKGTYESVAWIPANLLNNRNYVLTVAITTHNPVTIHCQTDILFDVEDNLNAVTRGNYKLQMHGVVRPYIIWETKIVSKLMH